MTKCCAIVLLKALEKISAYMKSSRFMKTPVNNKMAKWGHKKEWRLAPFRWWYTEVTFKSLKMHKTVNSLSNLCCSTKNLDQCIFGKDVRHKHLLLNCAPFLFSFNKNVKIFVHCQFTHNTLIFCSELRNKKHSHAETAQWFRTFSQYKMSHTSLLFEHQYIQIGQSSEDWFTRSCKTILDSSHHTLWWYMTYSLAWKFQSIK